MAHAKKTTEFKGTIRFISCSPHGEPEGVVLDDGTFIKVPPHSLLAKDLFVVGGLVSGNGELLTTMPNKVFHRAKIQQGKKLLADDSGKKHEREELKDQHKKDLKHRKDARSTNVKISGKVIAVGTKPKGEVDRLIFDDGTSVHIPKDVNLASSEVEIGDLFEVKGVARSFHKLRFLKAETIRPL